MDRWLSNLRSLWLLPMAAGLTLIAAGGCSLLPTSIWVFQGNNKAAEYKHLRGKRVVVVCRPTSSLQFNDSSVARDLARQVGVLLQDRVRHGIQIVDPREVHEWADQNEWEDYVEVGKALKADKVVGIDLEDFNLYQGSTLYQGKANMSIMVFDVAKGRDPEWEKPLPQTLYPPNASVPCTDMGEKEFRYGFVKYLAELISRHYYDHDPTIDFANSSTAMH